MKALSLTEYFECVENFLSEDKSMHLLNIREYSRNISPAERTLRGHLALAATAGFVTNSVPFIHLFWCRRWRYTARLLGKMHTLCWAVGFKMNCDVQEPNDFLCVLVRWTQEADHGRLHHRDVPSTSEVVKRVSGKLRVAHIRVLTSGFLPIVGPIVGFVIEGSLIAHFRVCAQEFYETLLLTRERPLPEDSVTALSQSAGSCDESVLSISYERCVEDYLSQHLSDEHMRLARAAAPMTGSRRMARLLSASSGMLGSWLPGLHVFRDSHQVNMLLKSLQDICWSAGVQHRCESSHGRDFERVLWRWASTRSEWSQNDHNNPNRDDREALIAAVSAKLRRASMLKLAFGFLPMIGPIAAFLIHGSMGARFYDVTRTYFAARYSGKA